MTHTVVARAMRVTAVLTVLSAALFVAGAQVAGADTGVTEGRLSYGVDGMVGIAAVILGLGGLVVGLLRRRRIAASRAATLLAAPPKPEPARSETAA